MGELFTTEIYKRSQGKIVRQATAAAVFVILLGLVWMISDAMQNFKLSFLADNVNVTLRFVVPIVLAAFFGWFSFRLVNMHRFADFLIHVEAEMRKVSWPGKPELIRSVVVVITVMFVLATVLFCYDLGIKWFFETLGWLMKSLFVSMGIFK